jgi:hypothetical protein
VEAAGRFLAKVGGSAAPGEVGAEFGWNKMRQTEALGDLAKANLIERSRTLVKLTAAGWARFGGLGPGEAGAVLDRVLDGWPPEHHAFITLLVCSTIARHHLGTLYPSGHLGFIAIGETGTGKTSPGLFACHLFGFDAVDHTLQLPAETGGSVLGRREQVPGCPGYRLVTNPAADLPFVLLDEFDKADGPTQRRTWPYMLGEREVKTEGDRHVLRPTPLLTLNPPQRGDRYAALQPATRKRCVVLDTGWMRGRGAELGRMLRTFYEAADPRDRLALDRLKPPQRLAPEAVQVLEQLAAGTTLTEAGREEFPGVRSLELAALGRCALLGPQADHVGAAVQTVIDYLIVTQTVAGQVEAGWGFDMATVRDYLGDGGQADQIEAALARACKAADAARETVHRARRTRQKVAQDVTEDGARLQAQLRQLHDALTHGVPVPRRADAAALRKVLKQRAEDAGRAGTRATLDDIAALVTDPVQRARRLLEDIAQDREAELRHKAELAAEKRRAVEDAKADEQWRHDQIQLARGQQRAARQQARSTLAEVVAAAKPLEALYKRNGIRANEPPAWQQLAERRIEGRSILIYRPGPPRPRGWWKADPPGEWRVVGGPSFIGRPGSCHALEVWGDDTRAVLAPVLAHLQDEEDRLCAGLGRQPRADRPTVRRPTGPVEAVSRPAVRVTTPVIAGLNALPYR